MQNQAPGHFHLNILRTVLRKIVPFLHSGVGEFHLRSQLVVGGENAEWNQAGDTVEAETREANGDGSAGRAGLGSADRIGAGWKL